MFRPGLPALSKSVYPPSRTRSAGFTLLEVLVAIGIFALFSAMAYGGLIRVLDTRDRLDAEREYWRGLTMAMLQIEDDLSEARGRSIRGPDGVTRSAFIGQAVDNRALGEPSLEFTRSGLMVIGDGARSDMQRVGYRLRDGTLERLVWPALDQPPVSEPRASTLLEHVNEMRVRFYQSPGGWVDAWPPSAQSGISIQTNPLPAAVELTLKIEGRGEIVRVLRVQG